MSGTEKYSVLLSKVRNDIATLKANTSSKITTIENNYKAAVKTATDAVSKQKSDFESLMADLESDFADIESALDAAISTSDTTKTDTETTVETNTSGN